MRVWHPRAPALRVSRPPSLHRRARACPSPAFMHAHSNDRGGNPLGCACGIRGPPRSGCRGRLPFTVGRGPVPRHASRCEKNVSCSLLVLKDLKRYLLTMEIAGDRPPRYDKKNGS